MAAKQKNRKNTSKKRRNQARSPKAVREGRSSAGGRGNSLLVEKTYRVYLLPLVISILLVPLVVRAWHFDNILYRYQPGEAGGVTGTDYFLHGKGVMLALAAGLALFFIVCLLLLGKKLVLPKGAGKGIGAAVLLAGPAVYLFLALLSSAASPYRDVSFQGAKDLFAPFPVLAAYVILFYYSYFAAAGERQRPGEADRFLIRTASLLLLILGLIGILQLVGADPFTWEPVRALCGLDRSQVLSNSRVYLTLYHPDYAAVLLAVLLPPAMAGFILEGRKALKGFHAAAFLSGLVSLLATQTRAGIGAGIVGILIFLVCMKPGGDGIPKSFKTTRMIAAALIAAGLAIGLIFTNAFGGGENATVSLTDRFLRTGEELPESKDMITGILTGGDGIHLQVNESDLTLVFDEDGGLTVKAKDGEVLTPDAVDAGARKAQQSFLKKHDAENLISDGDVYALKEEPFTALRFWQTTLTSDGNEVEGWACSDRNTAWFFTLEDGQYLLLNRQGYLVNSIISEDALPESFYGFASFRGYVWSKTLARLKRTLLVGTGPDTFSLFFPNNDYGGRHRIGQDNMIYNKPHSWYLQMAAETGVLSALVMIIFLIAFAGRMARQIRGAKGSPDTAGADAAKAGAAGDKKLVITALFISVLIYLVTGLTNDAMILTAPVFWCLLGYGGGAAARE